MQTMETQGAEKVHGTYDVGAYVVFRVQGDFKQALKFRAFCESVGEPSIKIIHSGVLPGFKFVFWAQVISFLKESVEAKLKELGIEPV